MIINDNYSISRLFVSKTANLAIDKTQFITINFKSVHEFFENNEWNGIYHLWTKDLDEWHKMFPGSNFNEIYDYIHYIIFDLGKYKQYWDTSLAMQKYIQEVIKDTEIDFSEKKIIANGVTITPEIWNYIIYLLKLSQGEKATQPPVFHSEAERAFYLKQLEYEKRIQKIKQKGNENGDKDSLIKTCLYIVYAFPSLTFDYLFEQTMAQIYWLQKMAAGSISYGFNEKAFAAGNVKKGKKLDFFIK